MKKIRFGPVVILTLFVVFLTSMAFAGMEEKVTEEKKPESLCPHTRFKDGCLGCHVMSGGKFVLKETSPDAHLDYPRGVKILNFGEPTARGYFMLGDIDENAADNVQAYFRYLEKHKVTYAILDIQSGGGSLFSGWRIKHLIDEWESKGRVCETRVHGIAASAAAIIFCAGTKGYRVAGSRAELMFHELFTFKFMSVETPSDQEDQARVLRHLQDSITEWLAKRGNLTKADLDAKMRKKELWVNGIEAKMMGLCDVVVGE